MSNTDNCHVFKHNQPMLLWWVIYLKVLFSSGVIVLFTCVVIVQSVFHVMAKAQWIILRFCQFSVFLCRSLCFVAVSRDIMLNEKCVCVALIYINSLNSPPLVMGTKCIRLWIFITRDFIRNTQMPAAFYYSWKLIYTVKLCVNV